MGETRATLGAVRKARGVAGQVSYSVAVTYPGEPASVVTFVGSVYGGPVVMVTASGVQTFVTDPGRFGEFGPVWVARFFGEA
jgi:hypothetical protein